MQARAGRRGRSFGSPGTPNPWPARACISAGAAFVVAAVVMAPPLAAEMRGPQSVAPIAEELIEAVVNVSTSQAVKGPQGLPLPSVPKDSPYHEYFDDFFDNRGQSVPDRMVSSLGSGFIIDGKEGLIVTNNHVIDGAEEIQVNLHDGSKLKAQLLAKDTKTDIALLKVNSPKELKAAKFGSSAALRVGDWVMAIGNPFGLGGSVTVGIVSAKARNINSGPYDDYLQTDASINKGNSGGPLFNMEGEVVGVNTAIISPTGGSIGIGFAVPSDTVVPVVQQLRQFGEVRRGWLGVKIQSITEDMATSLKLPEGSGALVATVTPDGPAAKAGLVAGDVITRFDNQTVAGMRSLPRLVAQAPIDKEVDVEVLRKGEKKQFKVVVGRLKDDEEPKAEGKADKPGKNDKGDKNDRKGDLGDEDIGPGKTTFILGLKLSSLTNAARAKYGFDAGVKGALVDDVDPKSPVASKIQPGDLIVQAGNEPVSDPEDVVRRIAGVKSGPRKTVMLELEDAKGAHRFVTIPVE